MNSSDFSNVRHMFKFDMQLKQSYAKDHANEMRNITANYAGDLLKTKQNAANMEYQSKLDTINNKQLMQIETLRKNKHQQIEKAISEPIPGSMMSKLSELKMRDKLSASEITIYAKQFQNNYNAMSILSEIAAKSNVVLTVPDLGKLNYQIDTACDFLERRVGVTVDENGRMIPKRVNGMQLIDSESKSFFELETDPRFNSLIEGIDSENLNLMFSVDERKLTPSESKLLDNLFANKQSIEAQRVAVNDAAEVPEMRKLIELSVYAPLLNDYQNPSN